MQIRQPIVTVAGHVDHGKTSLLDTIRQTKVAEKEAGAITQKISFSTVTKEFIETKYSELLKMLKIKIQVPGFLFIDTPGHAAFTNLRQRGGSIADLAILVIDINEGIMEQTRETIEILKANRTPFLIVLNKIDKLPGWKPSEKPIFETLQMQQSFTLQEFNSKVVNIITALSIIGFDAELYWQISDFTKKVALVPCSAKTKDGVGDVLVVLAGLAQKYLVKKLHLGKEARGNIIEVIKEKGIIQYDCILCDGTLSKDDYLIIASFEEPIVARIKALFEVLPLGKGFKPIESITAATGFRVLLATEKEIYAGMPFIASKIEKISEEKKNELVTIVKNILKADKKGIIVKAESLGSLEALIGLLKKNGILIKKAIIGDITKNDVVLALSNLTEDPLNAVILGFNVTATPEAIAEAEGKVAIFTNNIIYRLIENFFAWRETKEHELERQKLAQLTFPAKIQLLKGMVFRRSKPAICGIKVLAGLLKKDTPLMNVEGKHITKVKSMQSENKPIEEARKNEEVAISLPDVTIDRQVKEEEILYSDLSEDEFKKLKANKSLLTSDELQLLDEIAEIKRRQKATWGV
ncbi:MAG: translation initiation factor IF-2 [Candidatus Pacearchaeota archaeon]